MTTEIKTIGEILSWVKGKKPDQLFEVANEKSVPYLSASYFRTNKPGYYANIKDKNCVPVKKNEVVLIWDGSNAGDVFCGLEGALSSTMVKFNNSDKCDIGFLYFLLKNNFNNLNNQTTGSTIPHVNGNVLKNIEIPITNLKEQKKITDVLTTIQDAVASQSELIAKLKELKQSVMHYLFTHGTKGEKTKMTEIGEIAESWEVVGFEDICVLQRGKDLTKAHFKAGNIPVAGSNGVIGFHDESNLSASAVTVGRSGSCGAVNYYDYNIWAHNTTLYVKDFKQNDPRFVAYYLEFLKLDKYKSGVSVPTLDRNSFKATLLGLPQYAEQIKIKDTLVFIDNKAKITQKKISIYQNFFKTLLHELMSGERRVKYE